MNRLENIGSTISAGENITADARNDIDIRGSSVLAETGVTLTADNNVTIEAAEDTNYAYFYFRNKESSGLSSTTTAIENIDDDRFAVISTVSTGGELNITAGNDLSLHEINCGQIRINFGDLRKHVKEGGG